MYILSVGSFALEMNLKTKVVLMNVGTTEPNLKRRIRFFRTVIVTCSAHALGWFLCT